MTQTPDYLGGPDGTPFNEPMFPYGPPKTSGLAIAALVCSLLGLLGCCAFAPSVVGIVLGGVSLAAINRGECGGRGLAISGIILGVIGVAAGIVVWVLLASLPDDAVVKGDDVAEDVRQFLSTHDIIEEGETIELLYVTGLVSPSDGCVVLTDTRLVQYMSDDIIESIALEDIAFVDYMPAASWPDMGGFLVGGRDNSEWMTFDITSTNQGDSLFNRSLTKLANEARAAVGRPPVERSTPDRLESDDLDVTDYSDPDDSDDR